MSLNPERYQAGWPTAVIASRHRTGILGMRNLARRGVPVASIDCDQPPAGFQQAYGPACQCPNPDEDSAGWLKFMIELATKLPPMPALIPASDQFLSAIAVHASALAEHYRIGAAAELQGELSEKASLYALAARHGMPIPRTGQVRSIEDLEQFAADAQFPCLLKPMSAREWEVFTLGHPLHLEKVAVAGNVEELRRQYDLVRHVSSVLSIQEIIAGPDTAKFVYYACYSHTGERLGWSLFSELRCHPIGFGCASVCQSTHDPEVEQLCDRFLRSVGCRGLCEIELKRDTRDSGVRMIEANPRLSGSGDASLYVGFDPVWFFYLDQIGVDVVPTEPRNRNVRHIALKRDFQAIQALRATGQLSWTELIRSYRLPLSFYDFDLREWRTAWETLDFGARVFLGPLLRHFIKKTRK